MSFKDDVMMFRDGLVMSRNILVEYIYAIQENTRTDTPALNIITDDLIEENKTYGTFDNSHLMSDLNCLRGILDVYDTHIAQLDEISEGIW